MPDELKTWRTRFDNIFEVVGGKVCFDDASEIKFFIANLLRVASNSVPKVEAPVLPSKDKSLVVKLQNKISFLVPTPKKENETTPEYSKRIRTFDAAKKAFYRELRDIKYD